MNAQMSALKLVTEMGEYFSPGPRDANAFLDKIEGVIQQAIDEAVKEERERYLALAMKWRTNTRADPFVKQLARPFIEALESLTGGSP